MSTFSFLTNHTQALLVIAQDPQARMRDIAESVGITERATQRIVAELVDAGYISREREGRRNVYTIRTDAPVPVPIARDLQVGDLLDALVPTSAA